jgi:hypothetical protein
VNGRGRREVRRQLLRIADVQRVRLNRLCG